jgi:hypothetical protein
VKPFTCLTPKAAAGARRVLHLLGSALSHPLRIAIPPDACRNDCLVTLIDTVAYALPDQVVADGKALQSVLFEQFALLADVAVRLERLIDLEMNRPSRRVPTRRIRNSSLSQPASPAAGRPLARE